MNSIVSIAACADEIVGIEYETCSALNVFDGDRIDVMNRNSTVDLSILNSEIAAIVTNDDLLTNISPVEGLIECLVHVAIEAEGVSTDDSAESQIIVALVKSWETEEFVIRFRHTHHRPLNSPAMSGIAFA